MTPKRRFWHIAGAGASFQAGSSAVDSSTVMAALIHQLTGSALAVGAVSAILRLGWALPQLFVGFAAQRGGASMPYYIVGAFGRTMAIMLLALVLAAAPGAGVSMPDLGLVTLFLWSLYAILSGMVGAPYIDIVARSIPSDRRSRMLAIRFFGGGVAALAVAAVADQILRSAPFPQSYAIILTLAGGLMLVSSMLFARMGEPPEQQSRRPVADFRAYLQQGWRALLDDRVFRSFVCAQWCGGAVLMAAPFFVSVLDEFAIGLENVAILLAAQTAGALLSNPLWGWWGDKRGKLPLMRAIALLRILPPAALILLLFFPPGGIWPLPMFAAIFFVLGAAANGLTIAVIGLLMEISPEDRRPAYSGYFNSLTAPAYLTPLLGGAIVMAAGHLPVFIMSATAAAAQFTLLTRISISRTEPV